jgi:hypothetical protein
VNLRQLLSVAKEGWVNRPRNQLFEIRAQELRKMALGLESLTSASGGHARPQPDQDIYVKLSQVAQASPRRAVLEGWDDIWRLLWQVCEQRAIAPKGDTVELLNALERHKVLDFHAYALLRDMYTFNINAAATLSADLTPLVALDFAMAVRGAQRLLHRLIAEGMNAAGS